MPKKTHNEVLVGAFICAGLGLFVLLLFLMGSLDALFASTAVVEADFDDVQSLQAGDPVYLFGMKVGKVASITLLPPGEAKSGTIRVGMKIPAALRGYLRDDSIVKIDKSLTGNISVLIKESAGKPLGEGERLKGAPAVDIGAVAERVNQVLGEGEKVVSTITRIVKDIEEKGELTSAVSNAAALLREVRSEIVPLKDRLRQTLDFIYEFVEENRLDVRHTVANLRESTAGAKVVVESLRDAPEQVSRSLSALEKAGTTVGALVRENRGHVGAILEDLSQTSGNVAALSAEVKRRPWRLLYRPGGAEIKAMDLFDAAWAYNLGASELNRSIRDLTAHLEDAAAGGDRARELDDLKKEIAARLSKQREIEEAFWEKLGVED